jgi:hypothetical protein
MPVASAVRVLTSALYYILPSNMSSGPTPTVFSRTKNFIFRLALELSVTWLNWCYAAYARLTSELRARANQLRLRGLGGVLVCARLTGRPAGTAIRSKTVSIWPREKSRKMIFFIRSNFIIYRSGWVRKTDWKVKYNKVRKSGPSQPTLRASGAQK